MSENTQSPFEQAAAFQKIWMESISKVAQAAFSATPESVPPEILKQMRTGIFEALAKSWEEFMRSPQFLEAVKQMIDNAIAFKKLTSELLTKAHHEMQGTARTDIDTILLSLRHLETQVTDRMDKLAVQMDEVRRRFEQLEKRGRPARTGAAGAASSARASKERRRRSKPAAKPGRRS
jgi:methyl-accepting chemotaxis protein